MLLKGSAGVSTSPPTPQGGGRGDRGTHFWGGGQLWDPNNGSLCPKIEKTPLQTQSDPPGGGDKLTSQAFLKGKNHLVGIIHFYVWFSGGDRAEGIEPQKSIPHYLNLGNLNDVGRKRLLQRKMNEGILFFCQSFAGDVLGLSLLGEKPPVGPRVRHPLKGRKKGGNA